MNKIFVLYEIEIQKLQKSLEDNVNYSTFVKEIIEKPFVNSTL